MRAELKSMSLQAHWVLFVEYGDPVSGPFIMVAAACPLY